MRKSRTYNGLERLYVDRRPQAWRRPRPHSGPCTCGDASGLRADGERRDNVWRTPKLDDKEPHGTQRGRDSLRCSARDQKGAQIRPEQFRSCILCRRRYALHHLTPSHYSRPSAQRWERVEKQSSRTHFVFDHENCSPAGGESTRTC